MLRYVIALVLLLCVGCSVNQTFVDGVSDIWSVVGPEYAALIDDDPTNDPVLDADQVANRLRAVEILTETLEELKETDE